MRFMPWQDFNFAKWKEENATFDHEAYDAHWEAIYEKCETLDDLLEATKDNWPESPPFKPNAHYNKEGDIIHVYFSNLEGHGFSRWLNPQITIHLDKAYYEDTKEYASDDSDELVGMDIWGAQRVKDRIIEPFRPHAFYYNDSDARILLSEDEYEQRWLNPQITILTSIKTREVIGVEISELKELLLGESQLLRSP